MKAKPPIRQAAEVRMLERKSHQRQDVAASTWEILQRAAQTEGDKTCLTFFLSGKRHREAYRFTFREMFEQVNRVANLFHYLGIDENGVVAILLPNAPETLACILAAETCGRVLTMNPNLTSEEITRQLTQAQAQILVTLAPLPNTNLWQKVEQVRKNIPSLRYILQVDPARYLTNLQRLGLRLSNLTLESPGKFDGQKVGNLSQVAERFPGDHLSFDPPLAQRLAGYFPTGGTTGKPKLVPLSQQQKCLSVWSTRLFFDPEEEVKFFCGLPLFHNFALVANILVPWSLGQEVVLGGLRGFIDRSLQRQFWQILTYHHVGAMMGVPPFYAHLLGLPEGQGPSAHLRYCFSGDAMLPQDLARAFEARYGHVIIEGYGFTEGTCVLTLNPPHGERRAGACGIRVPYAGLTVAHLDRTGAIRSFADPGEVGQLLARGPLVFSGYLDANLAQNVWIPDPEGGAPWYRTGDLGTVDADGYFCIKGREVEQIYRKKHLLLSGDIEEVMVRHPAVELVALVPRPDPREGQVPILYVQPFAGQQVSEEELHDYAREHLPHSWQRPVAIRFVSPMPLSAVGKIYKPALIAEEMEWAIEKVLAKNKHWEKARINIFEGDDRRPRAWITLVGVKDAEAAEHQLNQKLQALGIAYQFEVDLDGWWLT